MPETTTARALILDDDVWFARAFQMRIQERFPELKIDIRTEPDISGNYDIYFLDDNFHGERYASALAHQVRTVNPKSLIIALSSSLDPRTLKDLINHSANAACLKNDPADLEQVYKALHRFLARTEKRRKPARESGLSAAIASIASLLQEWNRRLTAQTS